MLTSNNYLGLANHPEIVEAAERGEREIYVGTLNATTVSTRDVLRFAPEENAAAVIVFHNHPSGDPAPSAEDLIFTRKMVEAGRLMGIEGKDHLILGRNRFVSLKQRGAM